MPHCAEPKAMSSACKLKKTNKQTKNYSEMNNPHV